MHVTEQTRRSVQAHSACNMPDKLATLAKMQERLRANSEALASKVDENPDDPNTLQYLRLAADCANLEREVDLLSKLLLDAADPDGTG